ncbi:sulfotransferase family protein [Phytohabitans rumicis]|uniref:Branched chain amino acid aminotransferase n=1 Tax=Phytohabitans rumicis TaxID=1076125 RepID=A0A6V8L8E7_9ACTN|nr:sulfotransferase family protein [Phytohabitans rumicis]GFJ93533.1 branched chain amino acid aminotransferase [Phytohabitans rumicis]
MPVIAMWAHPRALSTAFLRMMIARGDVTVVHEPLVTLVDEGNVPLPTRDGGTVTVTSLGDVLAHLADLARDRTVFVKDTLEYRYAYLFDHPDEIADSVHTFIVRHPSRTISSHYAIKPTVTCPEIGYEHQYELFEHVRRVARKAPVVVSAEDLLRDPEGTIAAYCASVGLPFLPEALHWTPEDRAEWQRTRKWHLDVERSHGFAPVAKSFEVTVENSPQLRSYYDHQYPFYERLLQHAIAPGDNT